MGTTDAVYRGMALSIACAARGRQDEALAHAHEAAQDAQDLVSDLALHVRLFGGIQVEHRGVAIRH
jgi:hypothetical protein